MLRNFPHGIFCRVSRLVLCSVLVLAGANGALAAETAAFSFVKDGKALVPVMVPPDATLRNREAAKELADAIRKISGAEVEVIEGTPANAPERAIWVGMQPGMEKLFPSRDLTFSHPEEIRIVTGKDHLLLAGRDRFDPKNFTIEGRSEPIEGKQFEYGTANAVYTFIQDNLGVRWLWPGQLGTDYPSSANLSVPPLDVRYHPQFRNRMGIMASYDEGRPRGDETRDWARRQRLLLDSMDIEGDHAFADWWEKYGKTRPELFALQPDGTRGTYPVGGRTVKVCEGEPAVGDVWLSEVVEDRQKNPVKTIFNVAANDGWNSGICVDPRSQAMDPPITDATPLQMYIYANNVRLDRPPVSDRYVTFANNLARKLKEKYPNEELYVSQLAYGGVGTFAPEAARPDDNVIIVAVHNFLFRGKPDRDKLMPEFEKWSKMANQIVWRPNMGGSSGWHWGTPDVGFDRLAHDIKWVAERKAIGLYIDMIWYHWGTQGPLYYLLTQLAWDPYADPNKILEDFAHRAYGPAAKPMLAYWRLMEKMRNKIEDESSSRWRMIDSPKYYTAEFFKEAQDLLDQAVKETANGPDVYRQRVAFVQAGLDYTELVIDTRAAMQRWEDSKYTDEKAKAHVLANWAKSDEMRKSTPEYSVAWRWVFLTDPDREPNPRRAFGLHPKTELSSRFKEEYLAGQTKVEDNLE